MNAQEIQVIEKAIARPTALDPHDVAVLRRIDPSLSRAGVQAFRQASEQQRLLASFTKRRRQSAPPALEPC